MLDHLCFSTKLFNFRFCALAVSIYFYVQLLCKGSVAKDLYAILGIS